MEVKSQPFTRADVSAIQHEVGLREVTGRVLHAAIRAKNTRRSGPLINIEPLDARICFSIHVS